MAITYDPTTCPNPATTLADMHARTTAMVTALQGFVCDKDAESIARYNELLASVIELRDNTAAGLANVSTLIEANPEGLAAANVFIAQNQVKIDLIATNLEAIAASAVANTESATANAASAAANKASTETNAALLATVESLAEAVRTDVDALGARTTAIETANADQLARIIQLETAVPPVTDISALEAADVAIEARLDSLEESPQQQIDTTALDAANAAQDIRIQELFDSTAAADLVCEFATALKVGVDALSAPITDFLCTHGATATAVPSMSLNATQVPSDNSGATEL